VARALELRLAGAEWLVGALATLEAHDARGRVAFEQSHKLAPGDAGSADDADTDGGAAADRWAGGGPGDGRQTIQGIAPEGRAGDDR
jgi:hypothetical protein